MATKVGTRITPRAQPVVDVATLGATILMWLQNYRTLWLSVSGLLVLMIVGIWYLEYRKQVALDDLRVGVVEFQGGNAEKAIPYLEKVRRAFAIGAEAQAIGTFYLGEAYLKGERKEDAKKVYEEALALAKSSGGKTGYLRQMILMKLAQDAMQRGESAQARQWYDQAAEIEGSPFQSEALAQAGLALEKTDRSAAATYYEKLIAKNERYPLADVLKERVGK